jgi:hypothetical protein
MRWDWGNQPRKTSQKPEETGMEPLKAVKTSRMGRRALVLIGIGVVSAGSVAGVSFALTSGSTTAVSAQAGSAQTASTSKGTAKSSSTAGDRRQRVGAILRRSVHGEIELKTSSGFVNYDFDRGAVTSISSSSITVLRADNQSVTEAVSGSTHMPVRGVPTKGENVVVISTGGKAVRIFDIDPIRAGKSGTSTSGQPSASSALSSLS